MKSNKTLRLLILFITVFCAHSIIIVFLYLHRFLHITDSYGLIHVDTDGTLWHQFMRVVTEVRKTNFTYTNSIFVFPYGYNFERIPFYSLVYEINQFFIKLLGGDLKSLVLITNLSTLLAHPLTGLTTFAYVYKLLREKWSSFLASVIFTHQYYYVLMSAGSLSLDHFELIPVILLATILLVQNYTPVRSLIVMCLISILFKMNPYWAFFTSIFVNITFLVYFNNLNRYTIKRLVVFNVLLLCILGLTNLSYVKDQIFNFDQKQLITSGKAEKALDKLLPVSQFFVHPRYSILGNGGTKGDFYLGYVSMLLGMSALIILPINKTKYVRISLMCITSVLVAMLISAYLPVMYPFNEVYFRFFGMFRAVSRINIFATFYMAILAGSVCVFLYNRYFKERGYRLYTLSIVLLCIVAVGEGMNLNPQFWQLTDYRRIESFFSQIKSNPRINSIASYPMLLSDGSSGFPSRIDLLGQTVHQKPLANGADPFDSASMRYNASIRNIESTNTVTILRDHYIDTIIVYNHLLGGADLSNRLRLRRDLEYLGRYYSPSITHEPGSNEWDMSVFSIKNPILPPFQDLTRYKKNQYEYQIRLTTSKEIVVVNEPAKSDWRVYIDDPGILNILFSKYSASATSYVNNVGNIFKSWTINEPAGTLVTIVYYPHIIARVSDALANIIYTICLIILPIFSLFRRRSEKQTTFTSDL